jgi:colanic acid/amylovoran biosynthesis glycosyltransferase
MPIDLERPAVAHFIHPYLFITGSWIYAQLVNMERFDPFVISRELENLDEFPFEDVHCYRPPISGYRPWQIALRKVFETISRSHEKYCIDVIRAKQAKLLHAHFGTEGYAHLEVQRKVDIPLITTFYGADMSQLPHNSPKWKKRYKRLFGAGSLVLAEGPFMAQALVDLGCPSDKVRVQHLGVDVQRIPFFPRQKQEGETVRILMACSFREKKGIPYGVQAFAQAVKKYPDMVLQIIGGAKTQVEQQLMDKCKSIAQNEGVAEKVFFLGYIPYSEYLKETTAAHFFLAPSVRASNGDTEGGAPVAVIEASAAGMPVIATRHCDIPNIVIDCKSGFLVPERDVTALTEAILKMASTPETWIALGTAGRKRVEEEFDVFKQVARLEDIYGEFVTTSE